MKIRVTEASNLTIADQEEWERIRKANFSLISPFFHCQFFLSVASVRKNVKVAILYEGGSIRGFFPFQANWTGLGRPVGFGLSDYHGFLLEPGCTVSPRVLVSRSGLKSYQFDHVPASQKGFMEFSSKQVGSPYMDLSCGYNQYCDNVRKGGSKQIKKVGTLRRKLERERGRLSLDYDSCNRSFLEKLFTWKSRQYYETGTVDPFTFLWVKRLANTLFEKKDKSFQGLLTVLFLDEKPVAIHFGIASDNVLHYWFPSYDPEYKKYSPGLIMLLMLAEEAAARGIDLIDLGKGKPLYKKRLMSGEIPLLEGSVDTSFCIISAKKIFGLGGSLIRRLPFNKVTSKLERIKGRYSRWKRFR